MSGETTLARMWVLSAVAVVLGVVGGGAAFVLFKLIGLITHITLLGDVGFDLPTLRGYHPSLWLVPIAVGGGLLVSLFAAWSPVIRGHGIPESLEAILDRDSRIRPRAAIAKPLSAAITIGTGGPFGAEGPIIVTGGSIGSLIGQLLSVSAVERKIMLATGAAAGMSATFNTPIAAVILAIELILFERSLRVIVPLSIASGIAAAIHVVAFGGEPLFAIHAALHVSLAHLPLFAVVGVASGLMAIVLNKGLFGMEAAFRRLPVNIFWWPAIGALGFALIGLAVPRTLSMGYSAISDTLNGNFTMIALVVLLVAKLLSWLVALGSQTSGGTLAPMFLVGATMGSLFGNAVNAMFPAWHVSPAAFALVAMGATFGAATKAFFAAVVFAAEVTGEYTMLVPLMIGAAVAELVVEGVLSDRLMTEKLSHRGFRVEFRTAVDTLRTRVARQIMREPVIVGVDASVDQARHVMSAQGLTALPVVDAGGRYLGLVTAAALTNASAGAAAPFDVSHQTSLAHFLTAAIPPIEPGEYLSTSLERFLTHRVDTLPVVDHGLVVGMLSRDDVEVERYRRGEAQEVRQSGWMAAVRWPWRRGHAAAIGSADPRVDSSTIVKKIVIPAVKPPARYDDDVVPEPPANDVVLTSVRSVAAGSGRVARRPAHDRLLPDPVQLTPGLGQFILSDKSRIVVAWDSAEARTVAERLAQELRRATGFRLRVSDGRAYRDDISLKIADASGVPAGQDAEGYVLTAGVHGVSVTARTLHGLHNGAQTIRQLLPVWASSPRRAPGPWAIPAATIVDYPAREYRALRLDLSRDLLSPDSVRRIVDRIAAYKLNALRLVFSPSQMERLAAAEAMGALPAGWSIAPDPSPNGMSLNGYWTALEYRSLVDYADARFVTVTTHVAGGEHDQAGDAAPDPLRIELTSLDAMVASLFGSSSGAGMTGTAGIARMASGAGNLHGPRGVEATVPARSITDVAELESAVFPRVLAVAEVGWSPRSAFAGGARAASDFLARMATQAPRLALHDIAFRAEPDVPWRLHMMTLPLPMHGRKGSGPMALVVAPGVRIDDLAATVDWGDGVVSPGRLVPDHDPASTVPRFRILADHQYAHSGTFRAAITVTSPGIAPARASAVLISGSHHALFRRRDHQPIGRRPEANGLRTARRPRDVAADTPTPAESSAG